jgi:phage tail P2-like protein
MSSALLPPNATAQERALADATARSTDIPTPLRDLWNPDTCPAYLLPWLAWGLGIRAWKSYWPENVKRAILRDAVQVAKRRGTRKSVEQVVNNFGANLALTEWWEKSPVGIPHTFEVLINYGMGDHVTEQFQEDILREVRTVKPVRSHFTVTTGLESRGQLGMVGIGRTATYKRLNMEA